MAVVSDVSLYSKEVSVEKKTYLKNKKAIKLSIYILLTDLHIAQIFPMA